MNKLYLLPFLLLCSFLSFGQTKGLIYQPASTPAGRAVLDPNQDGYTSDSPDGFKSNDRGSESEINYKAIPILENEPIQDPLRGPGCGFTDMVDSGVGDPVMFYYDGTNFLVRFRLNKTSPNAKGYSVLIDTDQKFGFNGVNADPDAVAGNPGFEMELVLKTNHGVGLYNINGTTTPTLIVDKDYEAYSQKSIAYTEQCGDRDYFYDFYLPWSDFGLPVTTKLRMAALTVMNPHPAMGNNAKSDVGGVDDRKYGGNYDKLFEDFIQHYNPTSPQDNNTGLKARTLCPAIDPTILVASTSITGTSTEAAGTMITVYKNNEVLGSPVMVTSGGTWSLTGVSGLAEGDVITASAKASGKEESESNCSGILVGQSCSEPAAPVLSKSNGGSNKYVGITVTSRGWLNLYLGDQKLVSKLVDAGTYYYCPAAPDLTTASNTCSGGNNLPAGVYRATLTAEGVSCTSNSAFLCVNATETAAIPVINSPITTQSRFITGTAGANAQVILKINGLEKVSVKADAVGNWSVPAISLGLTEADKVSAYVLETGKCQSAETEQITVTKALSAAPTITGTYCGPTAVVTGTSSEATGTTIQLFSDGSIIPGATTTTNESGNWQISGLSIATNAQITATATVPGKAESAASVAVTVKLISSNAGITINATANSGTSEAYILENETTISGTGPGGTGLVSLYLDEMFIGSGNLAGGIWTVKKVDFPNDFYLFAGAKLTATFTAPGGCESDHTAPTVAIRCAPIADKAITPASLTLCSGATQAVTVPASELLLIYQLYNGTTPIGSSRLGTGGDLVLTSPPLTATTANTILTLTVKASRIPYVEGFTCEQPLSEQVTVTLNPKINDNTISLSGTGPQVCGPTDMGTIIGSTPTGGDGVYTYQWEISVDNAPWEDIANAVSKDYSPGVVSSPTRYRRKVFSGACANTDASAFVEVTIQAAVTNTITYSGQAAFCISGNPVEIQGNAEASFSYQWQSRQDGPNFEDIAGATSPNYMPASLSQTTTFRRVVRTGTCDSYSNAITIRVDPAVANNNLTAPAGVILCGPGNVGKIEGSVSSGGDNTYTYRWQKSTDNGATYSDISPAATTQHYTPGAIAATTYFRRMVTSGACVDAESNVVKIMVISAAKTTITTDKSSLTADGASSTLVRVQLKDDFATDVTSEDCALNLSTDKGIITNIVYAGNGAYTATLTAGTTAGVARITGTLNGTDITDDAEVTFVSAESPPPAPTVDLAATEITASPNQVNADGTSFSTATVTFKDYDGNAIAVDASKVVILLDDVPATAVVDKGNGVFTAQVPARTTAATVVVTAKYDGTAAGGPATVVFVPVVDLAATEITASPNQVNADGTSFSTATVTFKDYDGNAIAVDASKVVILLDDVPATVVVDKGNGVFTAQVPARTTAATVVVTGKYADAPITDNVSVTFVPVVDLAATEITASPEQVNADGTSFSTATVTFKDYDGNAIGVDASKVVVLLDDVPATTVVDKGNGVFTAQVPARTTAATVVVTAKYDGTAAGGPATVVFVPVVDLAATEITASPNQVNADGTSFSTATVTFKDYDGNAIAVDASKVVILLDDVPATVVVDKGNGVFTAQVPARTTAATVVVTGKYADAPITDNVSVTFVPVVDLAATEITASPNQVNADGTSFSTATVTFKDYDGNAIAVDASKVVILLDDVPATVVVDKGNGVFTAQVPARTTAATVVVTGKYADAPITDNVSVTFVPVVDLAATEITASPNQVNADGTSFSTATVTFKDYDGNAIAVDASKVVVLLDDVPATAVVDKGNGVFTAQVPARTTAATVAITAKYDGAAVGGPATVVFVPVVAPVLSLQLSTVEANPTTVEADGVSTSLITVQLKDGNQNNITTSEPVIISSSFGTVGVVTNNGNGQYTATLTATTTGTATIKAQVGSGDLATKPVVTFVSGRAAGAASTIAASTPAIPADGVSTSLITITLFDARGNRLTTGGDQVVLSTTAGTLGAVTDNNNGTYTVVLTSGTISGTAVVSGTVNGEAINSAGNVAFTSVPDANRAPVAVNDSFTGNNQDKLTGNVLLNDTDADGNQLSLKLALVRQPVFGTVVLLANGSFTYTPRKGYVGDDSFTYEVCDNGNPVGCTQATVTIQVQQGQVFIPEGFSPDGNGDNDLFVVYGAEQYKVSLKVFNRWGDIVYESKIYKNDWNGIANTGLVLGNKLPDGTYFYIIDLNNGEKPKMHSLIIKRK